MNIKTWTLLIALLPAIANAERRIVHFEVVILPMDELKEIIGHDKEALTVWRKDDIPLLYIPKARDMWDAYHRCLAGHELDHYLYGPWHNGKEFNECK